MIKHWLLNTAVEFGVPLTHIFPEISLALNVKPVPGCGSDDYAKGLIELFDLGMISLASEVEGDDNSSRTGVLKILERFRTLSKEDSASLGERDLKSHQRYRLPGMQVSFRLTALGGGAWESIAHPDWTKYLSVLTDLEVGDLFSANRDLLLAYMGWFPEIDGNQIHRPSVTWQTHADFDIVYWKRLPLVYHASFELDSCRPRWVNDPKYSSDGQPKWFSDWTASITSWHKEPWELTDWPSE